VQRRRAVELARSKSPARHHASAHSRLRGFAARRS
jgi:hypothetical protein